MKKFLKIFTINISIIIIILLLCEFVSLLSCYKQMIYNEKKYNLCSKIENKKITIPQHFKKLTKIAQRNYFDKINYFNIKTDFRKPAGLEYANKTPIVLLGCSFPYGYALKDNETFHYLLAENIKSPVYNLSLIGGSTRETLYILRNPKVYPKLLNNNNHVRYFIYTYIPSHKKRLYANFRYQDPLFKNINNHLVYHQNELINRSFFLHNMALFYAENLSNHNEDFKLLKLYFKEINRTIQSKFDNFDENSKLVILIYGDTDNFNWSELESDGIIIINLDELLGIHLSLNKEYTLKDGQHPNAKAWEVIVPALVKELKL